MELIRSITSSYFNPELTTSAILSVLLIVFIMGAYEFLVYRLVSHRSFYDRSFNICIGVIPFFLATIIMSLQSSLVITLGTIGALAILRFRTAVRDPVDMLYLLWSVHTGITCGCRLYELCILTSIVVTVILLCIELIPFFRRASHTLVLHCDKDMEKDVTGLVKGSVKHYRLRSRNLTQNGADLVIEFTGDDTDSLISSLRSFGVKKFSVLESDQDSIT